MPDQCGQQYFILAPYGRSYISCCYALLSTNSQAQYEEMLTEVRDRCRLLGHNPTPSVVFCDFQQTVIQATQNILGGSKAIVHKGCFYHLRQSTWKKVTLYVIPFRLLATVFSLFIHYTIRKCRTTALWVFGIRTLHLSMHSIALCFRST